MNQPLLELDDVRVSYGQIEAVRGVSLEIYEGEFVGLIGPNGAGKSTTLHAITGLVPVAEGDVRFEGVSLKGQPTEMIARRGLSLVPEGRQVFTRLKVEENLRLAAGLAGHRDLDDVYRRFPILETYRDSPTGNLSGGEQQQLAIARALLQRPRLLMLDEPSLGLAPRLVKQVFDILVELRAEGVTILLVEQNAAQTIKVSDKTWIMRNGSSELLPPGSEEAVTDDLLSAYLGGQE